MRVLFVSVVLVLQGCVTEPEPCASFHPHEALSEDERAAVARAFSKWPDVRWTSEPSSEVACSVRVVRGDEIPPGDLGAWRAPERTIVLTPERMRTEAPGCSDRMADCIESVTMHEIGHALGCGHVDGPAVMAANGPLLTEFTDADRAACAFVR